VVGVALTVATAGWGASILMASELSLAGEMAVGAAAGIVGSVTGNLVTAACDKEPITAKMVLGSIAAGAISGLGALAGPAGQGVMRIAMEAGKSVAEVTACGFVVGCTVGATIGVAGTLTYDAVTDTPVSAVSVLIGGLAGMGSGLLATRAVYGLFESGGVKTMPVMMADNELGDIVDGLSVMNRNINGQNVGAAFQGTYDNINFFSYIDDNTFRNVGLSMLQNGQDPFWTTLTKSQGVNGTIFIGGTRADAVVACHGFGQHCFVMTTDRLYRPVTGSQFVQEFSRRYGGYLAQEGVQSIKLFICFSGGSPKFLQTAQKFATSLQKTVYATKHVSYPSSSEQLYRTFT
jgi:hypothetical protein